MLRVCGLATFLLLFLAQCVSSVQQRTLQEERARILAVRNNLQQLSLIMPGIYTNTPQHQAAPDDFYHIIMKLYRIWPDRDDGAWFYIEQAQFEVQDQPYRQRVYRLTRGERDTLISQVYTFYDPKPYTGKGEQADFWKTQRPAQLIEKEGCAVYLTRKANGLYTGGTRKNTCFSKMAGAAYAESVVTIGLDEFTSLDQGYDQEGKQVWGSEKGAYRFVPYVLEE